MKIQVTIAFVKYRKMDEIWVSMVNQFHPHIFPHIFNVIYKSLKIVSTLTILQLYYKNFPREGPLKLPFLFVPYPKIPGVLPLYYRLATQPTPQDRQDLPLLVCQRTTSNFRITVMVDPPAK